MDRNGERPSVPVRAVTIAADKEGHIQVAVSVARQRRPACNQHDWTFASAQRYWHVTLTLEMSPSGTVPVPFVTTHVRVGGIGCAETVTE
jgi:hypothetical protein